MRWKRPESVLVVVSDPEGQVLMLERRQPPGYWQSVTGSLEAGETPLAAARRELREETGIEAGDALRDTGITNRFPIHPAWRARYAPEVSENTEHVFHLSLAQRPPVRLDPDEHVRFRWLPAGAAARLASSHTNRDAILTLLGGDRGRTSPESLQDA